jgi:aspartyl/asparaginyl beta-hydroxylase (cupin superfamily)
VADATIEIQTRLTAAARARQQGAGAEELRLLEEALRLAPDNPFALNARGMRALNDRDFDLAARLFGDAAAADPNQPALWMNLATAERQRGQDDGERAALDRALQADRFHFMALLRKAELEARCGTAQAAVMGWNAVVQAASSVVDRPPVLEDALARGQAFLSAHSAAMASSFDSEFGAERAEDPDLRRFNACLDHVLGKRAIYRNQCEGLHYPFLPADEFFDRRLFPWMEEVEARTPEIRAEALDLLANATEDLRPYVRMEEGLPANKWSQLDRSLDWGACFLWEYGTANERVLARCPATSAALESLPRNHIPGRAPTAFFSILKAGARIPPHTGVTNTRAIVHLPLVVPSGCRFRVGGETREWKEGQAFVFDDTIEHEAVNESERDRIILIFDVWNPHLTPREQDLIVRFFALHSDTAA